MTVKEFINIVDKKRSIIEFIEKGRVIATCAYRGIDKILETHSDKEIASIEYDATNGCEEIVIYMK